MRMPILLPMMAGVANVCCADAAGGLTVAQMLRLEAVGDVVTLPDGRILYEYLPPYEERASFEVDLDDPRPNAHIMIANPAGQTKALFTADTRAGYLIAGVSPSGTRVALHVKTLTGTSAVIVDTRTGTVTPLEYTPYGDFWDRTVTWISDTELLYSVAPLDYLSLTVGTRRSVAAEYARRWQMAFEGHHPTADVLRSRPQFSRPPPVPGQLVRANAVTGSGEVVADGLFLNRQISPSARYVASLRRGDLLETSPSGPEVFVESLFATELQVIDLGRAQGAKVLSVCQRCDVSPNSVHWAPDESLTFFARQFGELWAAGRYFRYDPRTHISVPLTAPDARYVVAGKGDPLPLGGVPLGRGIAVATRDAADHIEWVYVEPAKPVRSLSHGLDGASPEPIAFNKQFFVFLAQGDLWRVDVQEHRRNLTSTLPALTSAISVPRNRALVEYGMKGARAAAFVDLTRGMISPLGLLGPDDSLVGPSPSNPAAVVIRSDKNGVRLSKVPAGPAAIGFAHLNEFLADVRWPERHLVPYRVGSRELNACVLTMDAARARADPIVVYVYPDYDPGQYDCGRGDDQHAGRPTYTTRHGAPDLYYPDYLATLGYTAVVVSTPLDILNTPTEALAGYDQVVEPAIAATVTHGLGDAAHIGLFGVSQGGFSVLKLLTQSDRYAAAIAMFSDADFASDYATIGSTRALVRQILSVGKSMWFTGGVHQARSPPWQDPQWYVRSSPYFSSTRIKTPLLMVQADLDTNFQMSQFDELYTSLYSQRKEVDYVRYWGEGHGVASPANIRDLASRIETWFSDRLKRY